MADIDPAAGIGPEEDIVLGAEGTVPAADIAAVDIAASADIAAVADIVAAGDIAVAGIVAAAADID
jgi:hypothetical protein